MKTGTRLQFRPLATAAGRAIVFAALTFVLVLAILGLLAPPAVLQTQPGEPSPDRERFTPYELYGYPLPHPRV
jgi:hypothetical protein